MIMVEATSNRPGPVSGTEALARSVEPVPTGLADWDAALHGGPVPGSTILLYGTPGAGKSSEALRLAGAVAVATDSKALVLSCEMPEPMLASYCTRLDVPLERVDFWCVHAWRTARQAITASYRAIVVDSIQPLADGNLKRVLHDLARAGDAVRVVVARVNRNGEPSGVRDLDHDVDVVARITARAIEITTKNRFAPLGSAKRVVSSGPGGRRTGAAPRSGRRPRPRHAE